MAVILSPAAAERARKFIEATPGAVGLRCGVKKSGCSGFAYVIDVTTEIRDDDRIFEQGGVQLRVDAGSLEHVDGTEIDYVQSGLNSNFVFRNPRLVGECGCGESFTTNPAHA